MAGTWWPALRAGELIAYLTDEEMQRLSEVTVPVLAEPGDVIFYKGAPSKNLIIVEEGEVEAFAEGADGRTTVLGSAGAGSVMGELGFLDGQPRANHVRAATACRMRRLTRDQLLQLAGEDSALFGKLVISLAELLAARYRRVVTELEPLRAPELHDARPEAAQALDVLKAVALETKNLAEL
jgi:CRP-like cAMP-binding protein